MIRSLASWRRALALTAALSGMLGVAAIPASAANEEGTTYSFEVTAGAAVDAVGIVTAKVVGTNVEINLAAENLGVASVVMHFHTGSACDAAGGIEINVPTDAVAQPVTDGSLRLTTTEPLGTADMENVYFNIHEAGNLSNVVACATLGEAVETVYSGQTADPMLTATNFIVGDTVLTSVEATGLTTDSVVMHFHTGETCDAMGGIVLGVDGTQVAVTGGVLDATFVAPVPESGFDDAAGIYFNVHEGANLANVLQCGTLDAATAPGLVADATTIDEIINATDYDVETDPEVLRLYQAFFNREPDVGGAIYWIGIRDDFGALEIAQSFPSASAEFQNEYADAASDEEFLTRVYTNMFDRVADEDGFAYWLDILKGTNDSGDNPDLLQGDRGAVVFYVAVNQEFVNLFPYLP